jgi:hypothetical protein
MRIRVFSGMTDERPRIATSVACPVVGVVLLGAAGLKLFGQRISALPSTSWTADPSVQSFAIVVELWLGCWLLAGIARPYAWLAAVGTFSSFTAISATLGLQGVADCGCFGTIKASPWHAVAADVVALLILAIGMPRIREFVDATARKELFRIVALAGGTALLLGSVAVFGVVRNGSLSEFHAVLRGEAITAPGLIDFGPTVAGDVVRRDLKVTNHTREPIRLIGGTSDCSCVTTSSLPTTIGPSESLTIPIMLKIPGGTSGTFTRIAELWTDCDRRRKIRLTLTCTITGEPSP